jgi:hypothetical protein
MHAREPTFFCRRMTWMAVVVVVAATAMASAPITARDAHATWSGAPTASSAAASDRSSPGAASAPAGAASLAPPGAAATPDAGSAEDVSERKPKGLRLVLTTDELVDLTSSDPDIAARLAEVNRRKNTALAIGAGTLVAAAGLMAYTLTTSHHQECLDGTGNVCFDSHRPNKVLLGTSFLIMLTGLMAGLTVAPSHREVIDIVNDWNARNPTEPVVYLPPAPHRHGHIHARRSRLSRR